MAAWAKTIEQRWLVTPPWIRSIAGLIGSAAVLLVVWQFVLLPLEWPPLSRVLRYFILAGASPDTYKAVLMTGIRAAIVMALGFTLAVLLAAATGRTAVGWCLFFFLLLGMQKIPAIAMIDVLVKSRLGIGLTMTTVLGTTVVTTFVWLVLHHRARTLDPREMFALRVVGFRGWRLFTNSLLPHLGSAIGGSARLAMSIAVVMVILGEWRGVWSDGSLLQYGLGVDISRHIEAFDAQARILATCMWLGLLGIILDGGVQGLLMLTERLTGVSLRR